ncbi:hypothetical protein RDI58_028647 [Solanum bulbocastanum]|uniref:Uncharacterized protein n=1 Tax=Solanum bulbocastanum TaxID=147425 RepID=A0AAN8XZ59_SOLBU
MGNSRSTQQGSYQTGCNEELDQFRNLLHNKEQHECKANLADSIGVLSDIALPIQHDQDVVSTTEAEVCPARQAMPGSPIIPDFNEATESSFVEEGGPVDQMSYTTTAPIESDIEKDFTTRVEDIDTEEPVEDTRRIGKVLRPPL